MNVKPQFKRLRSPLKLGLLFFYPLLLLAALYVSIFLYGNSRHAQRLITGLVTSVLPGSLEVAELHLDPWMTGARVYGVCLRNPQGQAQIEATTVEADISLLSLLRGEVDLTRVQLDGARVLVSFGPKGEVHIGDVFADLRRHLPDEEPDDPEESGGGITVRLRDIRLNDAQVLVHLPELSVLANRVDIDDCHLDVRDKEFDLWADVSVREGALVMLPEIFRLVDPKESDHLRDYRLLRASDPWQAAATSVPASFEDEAGVLSIPLANVQVERFHWQGEGFRIASVQGEVDGGRLEAEGRLNIDHAKRETIGYQVRGSLELSASSTALNYFAPGLFRQLDARSDGSEPRQGRFTFDVEGTLATLAGQLGLVMSGLSIAGWPMDDIALQVNKERGGPLVLSGQGLEASVAGGTIRGQGFFRPDDGSYALDLWLADLPAVWFLKPLTSQGSDSLFAGHIATTPDRPIDGQGVGIHLHGDLDAKGFPDLVYGRRYRDRMDESHLLAEATISGLSWNREESGRMPFERVALAGTIRLGPDGRVDLSGPSLASDFTVALDQDRVSLRGGVDLLTQTFDELNVSGNVRSLARLIHVAGLDARLATGLVLTGPWLTPEVRFDRLSLDNLLASGFSIGRVVSSFTTSLDIRSSSIPTLRSGEVVLSDVAVGGFTIGRIQSRWELDPEALWLRNTSLTTDFGRIDLDGSVVLFQEGILLDDPRLDFDFRAPALDLAALLPDLPVAGSIALSASLAGSANRPRLQGHFEMTDAILFDEWVDRVSASFAYSNQQVSLSDISVIAEDGLIEGRMVYDLQDGLRSAHLASRGLRLERIRHIADLGLGISGEPDIRLDVLPADPGGNVALPEALRPAPGRPDIQGSIIIRDFMLFGIDQGSLSLSVDTYLDSVHAVGHLTRDLETRIRVPFGLDHPIELSATFDHVPLRTAIPFLEGVIQRGELNQGLLEVELTLREPFSLLADLSLGELWLEVAGRRFYTPRPVHVTYSAVADNAGGELQHALHIPELSFGTEDHFLTLHGDIVNWSLLTLGLGGDMDASLITLLIPAIAEAGGLVHLDLDVLGTLDDPAVDGQIDIQDVGLTPRGLGEEILLRRGQMKVYPYWYEPGGDQHQMTIEIPRDQRIEGNLFSGAFSLSGQIHFDHFMPHDLELELFADNLRYAIPDLLNLSLNRVDLTLFSYDLNDPDSFFLSGNIFIQEGLFYQELGSLTGLFQSAFEGVFTREVERYRDPIWRQVPLLEFMDFDVGIRARDNVRVQTSIFNATIDLELQIDLTLQGTLKDPVLQGEVKVIAGDITYQNRRFEVQSCSLRFDGPSSSTGPLMPRIESCIAEAAIERSTSAQTRSTFQSETGSLFASVSEDRLQPYRIRVTAEGESLQAINLTLESVNVALDQRDILSLIFTGRTVDELTTAADQGASYEILFRQLIDVVESQLQDQLSIDQFTVIPSVAGPTIIRLREQVSQRLSVDVQTRVFGEQANTQEVSGELTLFDWLVLQLSESSDDENNVEVGGRLRLRLELD